MDIRLIDIAGLIALFAMWATAFWVVERIFNCFL